MSQMKVMNTLIERGWVSLRQLGILLDSPNRSVYGRQRGKNPIPTIRIGGIERVYTDTVKDELGQGDHAVLLSVLETGVKDRERKEKKDA